MHLELVTSISTECFIQALRRFTARRGRTSIVYSNKETNFVGVSAGLKKVDWEKVVSQETLNPITWKFIPPTATWCGRWWEQLIHSVKNLIVRVFGQASVNYEELLTILCDIDAIINCRPLTYISLEFEDLLPLTPSIFLQI
ncbi:integrase catalytic domain-containing protein [Trichonephila inaurata madagascariensis]|uniref:Integrase catalytic domain-containing protein n=1 Tax=Trichonephila inaurata madagascariensis TaxID=2747483 RepID=A0A8X6Y1T7_9ARAC|nr:integrase catalytic domain-containing protein [Trichonephila inaurata madagascariensis]